jgi:hypothetical protein
LEKRNGKAADRRISPYIYIYFIIPHTMFRNSHTMWCSILEEYFYLISFIPYVLYIFMYYFYILGVERFFFCVYFSFLGLDRLSPAYIAIVIISICNIDPFRGSVIAKKVSAMCYSLYTIELLLHPFSSA